MMWNMFLHISSKAKTILSLKEWNWTRNKTINYVNKKSTDYLHMKCWMLMTVIFPMQSCYANTTFASYVTNFLGWPTFFPLRLTNQRGCYTVTHILTSSWRIRADWVWIETKTFKSNGFACIWMKTFPSCFPLNIFWFYYLVPTLKKFHINFTVFRKELLYFRGRFLNTNGSPVTWFAPRLRADLLGEISHGT